MISNINHGRVKVKLCILFVFALSLILGAKVNAEGARKTCTYQTFKWNVNLRGSVGYERIHHSYDDLTIEEIDPTTGCSVCEEDQETISVPPLVPFRVCRVLAPVVRKTLLILIQQGEPIYEVTGYQVGRTRGQPDGDGNRTEFSNHSYGTAIDINPQLNGLYDDCVRFGPNCRLIRGGPWRPGQPGTLTLESPVVKAMKAAGFRWSGEIEGNQKDFMHFSLTGY